MRNNASASGSIYVSSMASISNTQLSEGRYISDIDDQRRQSVTVIGSEIKDHFFENTDPIGKSIDIDGRPFEIIGVAKAKGSVFGQSQDLFLIIPVETYFKMYGFRKDLGYNATAIDSTRLNEAMPGVRAPTTSYFTPSWVSIPPRRVSGGSWFVHSCRR